MPTRASARFLLYDMNTNCQDRQGFTLIELLVVISIIALLVSVLMPSLTGAREQAKSAMCLANLRNLGSAMALYHADHDGSFWPYCGKVISYTPVVREYFFWGKVRTDGTVDTTPSPFMAYIGQNAGLLACPNQPMGSYVPQGGAEVHTTNYGYNGYYLADAVSLEPRPPRLVTTIPEPAKLFVFNDTAMYWNPEGVYILQNSTYLEPISGNAKQQPTTHFRHKERTNALCADGHADRFDVEGGTFNWAGGLASEREKRDGWTKHKLGFVGTENYPHYAQP